MIIMGLEIHVCNQSVWKPMFKRMKGLEIRWNLYLKRVLEIHVSSLRI